MFHRRVFWALSYTWKKSHCVVDDDGGTVILDPMQVSFLPGP